MNKTGNSFDILPELHHIFRRIKIKNLIFWKSFYAIKLFIRFIRIQRWVTLFLGRQYFRSKDMIEIDITYDKKFDQGDSVLVFDIPDNSNIMRFGYPVNEEKDLLIFE